MIISALSVSLVWTTPTGKRINNPNIFYVFVKNDEFRKKYKNKTKKEQIKCRPLSNQKDKRCKEEKRKSSARKRPFLLFKTSINSKTIIEVRDLKNIYNRRQNKPPLIQYKMLKKIGKIGVLAGSGE